MSFAARTARSQGFRNLPNARVAARSAARRHAQNVGRRFASSGSGEKKSVLQSDLPWLITSAVVTIPTTYWILSSGPPASEMGYPGEKWHDPDEEHEEGEEGGEAEDEGASEGASEDSGEASESQEQGGDGEGSEGESGGDDGPAKSEAVGPLGRKIPKEDHGVDEQTGDRTIKMADAKGATKRRVESGNAIKQHELEDDSGSGDTAAASKTPKAGGISGKQYGLSNTDTKHSTDLQNDPERSKKGEGAPETAKLQGTVSDDRPLG